MRGSEGADKRELVLDAALRLFNERGFKDTPTALISKEAGVATGLLFHYFGTKEELVNALYLRCKESMVSALSGGLDGGGSFKERLFRTYRSFVAWAAGNTGEFLFFQQFSNSELIGALTRRKGKEKFAPLMDAIAEGARAGQIRDLRPDFLFEAIGALLVAAARYIAEHPARAKDEAFMAESFEMIWDSISRR